MSVIVNCEALVQASDFRIKRRQAVSFCWCRIRSLDVWEPIASRPDAHSQGDWVIKDQATLNSLAGPYDNRTFISHDFVYIHTCIHMYVRTCVCVCVRTYVQAYIHTKVKKYHSYLLYRNFRCHLDERRFGMLPNKAYNRWTNPPGVDTLCGTHCGHHILFSDKWCKHRVAWGRVASQWVALMATSIGILQSPWVD